MLYNGMELILREDEREQFHDSMGVKTWDHEDAAPSKTHEEWKALVEGVGAKVGLPVLYLPDNSLKTVKSGFLLSLEQNATEAKREERRQLTSALGFEEMGGLVGLASLKKPTNKDLLFMIDISYSMDEIAGYEEQMTPNDQIVNAELTRRLDVAGAELGELTISLMWNNMDDLDLHVINPHGDHLWFRKKKDKYTGELDVDMNAQHKTAEPVENIYWQDPPKGKYTIYVNNCDGRMVDYVVRVKQPGNMTFYRGNTAMKGKEQNVDNQIGPKYEIDYPMHPDWNGGTRITNATNNALTIYDKFTTSDDRVGLIWFNHGFNLKVPLEPRVGQIPKRQR